jgi:GGDEF domain-containing protein
VERGFFWSLLMVALALHFSTSPGLMGVFMIGAALVLGLSVMETSYAMAYKDDLTGLPARRALMRDLDGIGGTYSAAMVDVDHFKKFNDRYGHDVGDQVLRMVAVRLARAPGGGRAYRYGGEEFTLLFPGKSLQETLPHLKEARRSIEEAAFTLRSWRRPLKKPVDPGAWRGGRKETPKRLSVTVSIGVADSAVADPSPEMVLKKADQALYRAKKAGRNRVAK